MSQKPETVFIGSVHAHLPVGLYRLKTHNPYVSGPADMWYSGREKDMWIEYKYVTHIPKSDNIKLSLSAIQKEWLYNRDNEGRNVHVILGCKTGGVIFSDRSWEDTFTQAQLLPHIKSRKELADWITLQTTGRHANPKTVAKRSNRCERIL